ncbi:uncharacterized protein LOC116194069 [Punica granatum]|uniref:Uncharacterized protein LOC116194069 n=1 Tax=Punica granatum TaxID=22663 RepID=A0A6P8CAR7_PUNGR|nr:uncharacterized protein LOC116194069 [Punica granatum]
MIEWWRRRRGRSWFCSRSSVLWPAKSTLLKISSCLSPNHRAKENVPVLNMRSPPARLVMTRELFRLFTGNANGLVVLYKDMESCGEYADIRVLWEMVQSSRPLSSQTTGARTTKNHWKFCFRPYY